MIQVWMLDKENYFTGESAFVEEVTKNMTTTPYNVGYIKGKLVDDEWVEGATEEEIQEWINSRPKPVECISLEDEVKQLKADKDFLTACIMEMAQIVYS